ncbi:MAG: metallophosphoesterase [Myxococcales bacterium]|nr:metallophosphoesterase [Myxococcales bacterium]
MLDSVWNRKLARLPDEGVLLVATDLQGNLPDFEQMVAIYRQESEQQPTVLAFCGDLVHGPSPDLNEPGAWPEHLGTPYVDASAEILRRFEDLVRTERVFSLMGNHEHAHVGGPVVPKFYPDEAAILNDELGSDKPRILDMIRTFPLLATARCGIVLTHGAPRHSPVSAEGFERLTWDGYEHVPILAMSEIDPLGALLWARGCSDEEALGLLQVATDRRSGVVVHGHDVVRSGYAKEGKHHMVVSTSFALHDDRKVYLRVDLAGSYRSTEDLREGEEIRPLYV